MASSCIEFYWLYFNCLLKNISGFVPPFHNYSTKCIHLNLIMFAYSLFGFFQFIKSHLKGFTQSSKSYSIVMITIELFSKVLKAGNEFPWWFFSPIFLFFSFLLAWLSVWKSRKLFWKPLSFWPVLNLSHLATDGLSNPSSPDWNRLLNCWSIGIRPICLQEAL